MAKPRRNYTLDAEIVANLERYADQHFAGNTSKAAEHLLRTAFKEERRKTAEGLIYAGLGTAALICISLLSWVL